jgi:hypothetical protein
VHGIERAKTTVGERPRDKTESEELCSHQNYRRLRVSDSVKDDRDEGALGREDSD